MRKIGFIGAYDKTDLILYLARILSASGKKMCIRDRSNNICRRWISRRRLGILESFNRKSRR